MDYVYAVLWMSEGEPNVDLFATRDALEMAYGNQIMVNVIDLAVENPGEAVTGTSDYTLRYLSVQS